MDSCPHLAANPAWWTPRTVADGASLCCRLGPLTVRLQHAGTEWRLMFVQDEEAADSTAPGTLEVGTEALDEEADIERFVAPHQESAVELRPRLADRAVVIRPRRPLLLSSGAETTLYLSTPVWLELRVGGVEPVLLRELPALRLSDSWFGPSTREGELCYSDRTRARSALGEVPYRAHRVLTPVHIRNEASTVLPLDRLSLPAPLLSVYGRADGQLCTQGISLTRRDAESMAAIRIDARPPAALGATSLLSEARQLARGGLVRAFNLLFGSG